MRRLLSLALLALAGRNAAAQSVFDSELRLAPLYMQYQIKAPTNETITELAVPVFVRIPFSSNFTFDVGTAYAHARVTDADGISDITGLTDTQLRGNLSLGSDFVVVTAGVNLPTGRSSVAPDELLAAGRIGSDFLAFPISNMGTGFAFTGGLVVARPLGQWNLGFGGVVRHSASYEPYKQTTDALRFQPGDEYRARVGLDHPFGAGQVSLGLSYSKFGDDAAGTSVYNTGSRLIAQGSVTNTYAGTDVTVAGYNVFRGEGNYASGDPAGKENIANAYLGLGVHLLGTIFEPSIEGRHWFQDVPASTSSGESAHTQSSYLGTVGLRTRIDLLGLSIYPSGGYTMGRLAAGVAGEHSDLTGYRAQVAVRLGR